MFSTLKQRLLLALYVFLILSIPVGAYLASQAQNLKSKADETKTSSNKPLATQVPKPIGTAKNELISLAEQSVSTSAGTQSTTTASPTPEASTTIATTFGPTLSIKAKLEGRPEGKQETKMFVGIIEGSVSTSPKYLLSFNVNTSADGIYEGLSLAGLTTGSSYTALLKGQAQLTKAVSFTMSPNITKLNSDDFVTLLTGDLNEDNTINTADLAIIKSAMGSNSSSSNWKELADFNMDGVINILDYSILYKNYGKSGDSGVWVSPDPTATPSASLRTSPSASLTDPSDNERAIGGPQSDGYWMWIPNIKTP